MPRGPSADADRSRNGVAPVDGFFEFSLLGLLASGYLAVVGSGYLDTPTIALTAAGLLLRGLLALGIARFEISNRAVTAVTVAYIGFYPIDYAFLSREFLSATVHLVFFLAIVKVLTARTDRDYFYVKVIAFLELLAASVLSANLNFFVFLTLFLIFGVATFSSSEIRRSSRGSGSAVRGGVRAVHWRLTGMTVTVAFGILVMTGGLFFFLPRTARAAFQHLVSERYHLPGFSNEVTLGQIGEIKMRSTPVMHVRIFNVDRPTHLKWRGTALSQFDGRKWFNPPQAGQILRVDRSGQVRLVDDRQRWRQGRRISYEVHLHSIAADALFFAGIPEFLRINVDLVMRTASDSYRLGPGGITEGLRYGVYSFLEEGAGTEAPSGQPLPFAVREAHLRLPALDPRIADLARGWAPDGSPETRAREIERHLRNDFGYTVELPSSEPRDPLAHFLFERKKGHCEYFGSAMAIMLRTLDIPSRVVTGFQSGIFNPISGWHLIRASDAHSWVEAWLPGRGWTTFDPTPPDPNPPSLSLLGRLGLYIDAAETFWQDWVLNYNLEQQLTLAARVEQSSRSFGTNWFTGLWSIASWWTPVRGWFERYGVILVALAAMTVLSWYFSPAVRRWWTMLQGVRRLHRGEAKAADATLLYLRMLQLLHRRGVEKPPWLTPAEFARLLPPSERATLVNELTAAYNHLRFGGDRTAAPRMLTLLERLERAG